VSFLRELIHVMRWRVAKAIVLTVLAGALEGLGLVLLVPLLHALGIATTESGTGRLGVLLAWIGLGRDPTLPAVLALLAGLAVLQTAITHWQTREGYALEHEFVAIERDRMYRAIAGTSWSFFVARRASDFVHLLTAELQRAGIAAYQLLSLLAAASVTLAYAVVAIALSPAMSLLAFVAGLLPLLITWSSLGDSQQASIAVSEANASVYAAAIEHLGAMKTTKSYGAEGRTATLFAGLAGEVSHANARVMNAHTNQRAFVQLVSMTVLVVLLYVAARVLALPSADILVLLLIFGRLTPRLSTLQSGTQTLLSLVPSWAAVERLRWECESSTEQRPTDRRGIRLASDVLLENVSYRYERGKRDALREVTISVHAGTIVGLTGVSGCGKTTVADLLLGLLSPTGGRILIDGVRLDARDGAAWREQIGYVAQDTFLFHDTVRANLCWAAPAASDDDLREALRLAAADAFVAALPDGLDTIVGDRGVRLSGGERQRLALARALLRRPRLLILDEATSALDAENERAIQESIDGLRGAMTIVVITHRLTTLRRADAIYVMDDGAVVEMGRWNDLLQREGRLTALARAQGVLHATGAR
jgi:ATP-binding cassette subfamily C protein